MKSSKLAITILLIVISVISGYVVIAPQIKAQQFTGPILTISPNNVGLKDGTWWGTIFLHGQQFTPNGQVGYICADGQQSGMAFANNNGEWSNSCYLTGLTAGQYLFFARDINSGINSNSVHLTINAINTETSFLTSTEIATTTSTIQVTTTETSVISTVTAGQVVFLAPSSSIIFVNGVPYVNLQVASLAQNTPMSIIAQSSDPTVVFTGWITTGPITVDCQTCKSTILTVVGDVGVLEATFAVSVTTTTETSATTSVQTGLVLFLPSQSGTILVAGVGTFNYGDTANLVQGQSYTIVAQPMNSSWVFLAWDTLPSGNIQVDCVSCQAATMTVVGSTPGTSGALIATFIQATPANLILLKLLHKHK